MWNKMKDCNFLNQELIFPVAQRDIQKIVNNAINLPNVKKVIVFGSATQSGFGPSSDLDVFVEQSSDSREKIYKGVERAIDYVTNFDVDEALMKEINETGVVVFER